MALQIIQSVETGENAIPTILHRHEQNPEDYNDSLVLFGVGYSRMDSGIPNFHCWIEISGNIIDYSNEQKIFTSQDIFRRSNNINVSMSLDWTGVCSLLLDKLPPSQWLEFSPKQIREVIERNSSKISEWKNVDFLQAHECGDNPFA